MPAQWGRGCEYPPVPAAVLTEIEDGVLRITLNRPEARNSLNLELCDQLAAALAHLDEAPGVVAGVLHGADDFFSAGMDLKAFLAGEQVWDGDEEHKGLKQIVTRPTRRPLIAAIEGYAVAGGLELALYCDFLIAGRSAKVGIPEVTRSLVAAGGALLRLPPRVGPGWAMRLALTGEMLDAASAAEIGLLDEVVEDGTAVGAATILARAIGANGPLAVAASKEILVRRPEWDEAEFWERQREISDPVFRSADAAEGSRAFAEKRPPVWRGR
jgi:enoyl-CoA hydratase